VQFLYEASLINKENPVVSLNGVRLRGADLSPLDLSEVNLGGAILGGAILSDAILREARGVSEEQLEEQAKTLQDTTMPDGPKHP
jgi:uncharacterized protein YjbI with pentapeptide repeats